MGIKNLSICERVPVTASLLQHSLLIGLEFSLLKSHTHIKPHKGYARMILRMHLPIIVPAGDLCTLRVGNETRAWKENEMLLFDDSHEHEAFNNSDTDRVVLMIDIVHPDWMEYTAADIYKYKWEHINDEKLLQFTPKEYWIQWYNDGHFPIISQ